MNNKQKGFTLIELIIVIIILGILAAFAIPKYMELDKEARISTVKGLDGAIRAAAEMVRGVAVAKEITGTSVNIGTSNVLINATSRYPIANNNLGITAALSDTSGFADTYPGGVATFTKNGASDPDTCYVTYTLSGNGYAMTSSNGGC